MIPYILHVALLISICLLFYKIFLQRETFYKLNRMVLLVCLGLSFALPLITVPQEWALRSAPAHQSIDKPTEAASISDEVKKAVLAKEKAGQQAVLTQTTHQQSEVKQQQAKPVVAAPIATASAPTSWQDIFPTAIKWLFYLYWAGVAAFGLNLLLQVIVLLFRAYSNPVIRDGRFRIIEVKGDKAPCSFGNNIFINPEKYDWDTYNQILMHEKVHIQQRHSFDILLAEMVLVFQWFNPFAWLYRGELENNLEFLTDEAVLDRNVVEKESYQMSLLKVSAPHLALSVTTNYNQSLLKKRIVMMNAKKSNIHTMWKYFILVPLMAGLALALNQTVAFSQTTAKAKTKNTQNHTHISGHDGYTSNEGSWFATIKGEKMRMEFRSDDDNNSWSSNDNYLVSEFSALPKDQKGEFTLKREAGTMLFTGKFDGNEGYGHYKFTADKEFNAFLNNNGINDIEDNDQFAFFALNIKKEYVAMLKANGYNHLEKNELISMAALQVNASFIKGWKDMGYHLSPNDLVSAKALNVDGEFVSEIKKAGYPDIDFNQLISFKAQGIDGKYIASLRKAGKLDAKGGGEIKLPSANDISSYKALNVDSTYIAGLKDAGYTDIPFNDLTSLKALNIDPEYIKSLRAVGLNDLHPSDLMSLKSLGITADYVKAFKDAGYKDISANELMSAKSLDITPKYIQGFENLGYKNLTINDLSSLKSLGVTGDYIKGFEAVGYKDISVNELSSLKSLDVTPGFIKGFKDMGFSVSLDEATSLKAIGLTPGYVKEMRDKGLKSDDLNKYIQLKNTGFN